MRRRTLVIGASIGALALVALAVAAHYLSFSEPVVPALNGTARRGTVLVGGVSRSFLVYTPRRVAAGAPLVIAISATGQDAAMMRRWTGYELDQLADAKGFVVTYPDALDRSWNGCRRLNSLPGHIRTADDVGFIRSIVNRLQTSAGIDAKRVFALGYSGGGQMIFRVMHDAPTLFAGAATTAASLPTKAYGICQGMTTQSPIMLVNGTADPINPYAGGENSIFHLQSRGWVVSARANAEIFVRANHITSSPSRRTLPHLDPADPTSVEELVWVKDGRPQVVFDTVYGGGHVVPQPCFRYPRILGPTNRDLDLPRAATRFFGL